MRYDTSKLYLDDLTMDHVDEVTAIISHPEFFYAYLNDDNKDPAVEARKYCQEAERARHAQNRNTWIKGIFNENGKLVGAIDLLDAQPKYPDVPELGKTAEIGYFVKYEEQGKGIAAWGVQTLVEWGREYQDICYLYGTADPENKPSIAILENVLGLTQIAYIPQSQYKTRDGTEYRPRFKFEGMIA